MKVISKILLVSCIPTFLFCQSQTTPQKKDIFYDFSLIIDCREMLFSNDFKIVVNPDTNRNFLFKISYQYLAKSKQTYSPDSLIREPIKITKYLLTKAQLDTIYSLSRNLFYIPNNPNIYDQNIFNPPKIYDGLQPTVTLNTDRFILSINPDTENNKDFNHLIDFINTITISL
jgi:hypothetical protein